ncbi:ABC transporter ATP-binding protein [Sporomusa acidovorans]|uniref:Lipoprotein-releasing system ATP-binding protein LolD n=1 Tax=Sporomusa acidovorans (strain ATCC 49682 / DSM 3132 / Mol) TaxID=1123286 RepID=A0ABZ3IZ83_SPOA4|nr:ATP-binding cassette domain-containing protein [Sporomusa acidovorans]OZC17222.1 lipoprotein-releasing system ATP-binding protein LolD [Sporomusa acidovorans DSM 3132]SDF15093.1 putative ABC transport system ATP-binding protein [Sporomusa acidovorans]
MSNLLEWQSISKSYGDDAILSNIWFTLNRGTAIAIVGHSGGGKTTLLSIMGLLQTATSGQILIEGQEIDHLDSRRLAKLRGQYLSFVFQRARLINSLTALENVMAPAWFIRKGENVEQQAKDLLEQFGLSHRLYYKPQELSLGQLWRISLARALLLKPSILLADEPTNDLDPALAEEVAQCLLQARQNGAGVVIVTHDVGLAAQADQPFRLEAGTLLPVVCQ